MQTQSLHILLIESIHQLPLHIMCTEFEYPLQQEVAVLVRPEFIER